EICSNRRGREIHVAVTGRSGAESGVPDAASCQPLGLVVTLMPSAVIVAGGSLRRGGSWGRISECKPSAPTCPSPWRRRWLPLKVPNRVGSATGERLYVILAVAHQGVRKLAPDRAADLRHQPHRRQAIEAR